MANEDSAPSYWQNQLESWTKTKGLENYIKSGLQDSVVGKSGLFDNASLEAENLRAQALQQAQGLIGQAPVTGINPTAGAQQLQAANAQQAQRSNRLINSAVQGGANNAQSTQDWINQMMGSQSQAINAQNQNWQNYEQAMYQGAVNDAQAKNAATGQMYQTGGEVAGTAAAAIII